MRSSTEESKRDEAISFDDIMRPQEKGTTKTKALPVTASQPKIEDDPAPPVKSLAELKIDSSEKGAGSDTSEADKHAESLPNSPSGATPVSSEKTSEDALNLVENGSLSQRAETGSGGVEDEDEDEQDGITSSWNLKSSLDSTKVRYSGI